MASKKYKTGIVLSGGGARGFAHLGALQALHEAKIYPEIISGVSAGAIVGAFYAYGMAPEDIFDLLKKKNFFSYTKLKIPKNGLLSIEGLVESLKENIPCKDIKDLEKPAVFAVSNLMSAKVEYKTEGVLCEIVAASSAIPVLFSPITIDKQMYADGGLFDNMPVKPIRNQCEKIIGVHISPVKEIKKTNELDGLMTIATRTFQLSVNANIQKSLDQCDLLIEPKELAEFSILEQNNVDKTYKIGYDATKKALKNSDL